MINVKQIRPKDGGLPIYKFDNNFYTGPSTLAGVELLSERGVKTIFSVLPAVNGFAALLKDYAAVYGIKVVYFDKRNYRAPDFSKFVAREALKLSRTQKVAVCCIAGSFSTTSVGTDYLKLKKKASLLMRRKVKANQIQRNAVKKVVRRRIK